MIAGWQQWRPISACRVESGAQTAGRPYDVLLLLWLSRTQSRRTGEPNSRLHTAINGPARQRLVAATPGPTLGLHHRC